MGGEGQVPGSDGRDQLRVLGWMIAVLEHVRSTAEAVQVISEDCLPRTGASAGTLATVTDDPDVLRVESGFGRAARHRAGENVARTSEAPLCLASHDRATLVEAEGGRLLAVPLRAGGQVVGAVELVFPTPGPHRALVTTVAALWGLALGRARTHEAERAARSSLRDATNRLAFLAESTRRLNESIDLGETLAALARLSVPELGVVCGIHLLRGGVPRLTASGHEDPAMSAAALGWLRGRGGLPDSDALRQVLGTGRPLVVHLTRGSAGERALATGEDASADLRALELACVAIVPLTVHDRALGTMTLATRRSGHRGECEGCDCDSVDLELTEEIGIRAGTAIERAQLYQEQAEAIRQLQAGLLPSALPEVAGLELASSLVPTTRGADVGGDFYDAVLLRDGRLLLVIGDVQGKGLPAAATTGLVRHAVRAVGVTATRPSAVVAHVNEVLLASQVTDELHRLCTLCVLLVEPGAGRASVTLTVAGHPLPLLLPPAGDVTRVGSSGLLLGAFEDGTWEDVEVELERDDVLLCVTDGVTERRDGSHFFEEELESVVAAARGSSAAGLVNEVRARALSYSRNEPVDDLALVALRVR